MHGGHFVDHQTELGIHRRHESERGLSLLGVKALHAGLPDGRLHNSEHRSALTDRIVETVCSENIRAIATLGLNGYCGHDDHVATHLAAIDAQHQLALEDKFVPILALNHNHQGQLRIPVPTAHKLAALALHQSQFGESGELLESHHIYQPLFRLETYDIIAIINGR